MPRSLSLRALFGASGLAIAAVSAMLIAGCGGSSNNSAGTTSANGTTPTEGLFATLTESSDLNTGSGLAYTFTVQNNSGATQTIPAYVDVQGRTHPEWTLNLTGANAVVNAFPASYTTSTSITLTAGQTYTDSYTVGPQYFTNTGTYNASAQFVYITGTAPLIIGPVQLTVN